MSLARLCIRKLAQLRFFAHVAGFGFVFRGRWEEGEVVSGFVGLVGGVGGCCGWWVLWLVVFDSRLAGAMVGWWRSMGFDSGLVGVMVEGVAVGGCHG